MNTEAVTATGQLHIKDMLAKVKELMTDEDMRIMFVPGENRFPYGFIDAVRDYPPSENSPFRGMKVIKKRSMNVRPVIGSILPVLKPSKNRSARIRKKLHKRGARPLYGEPMIFSISEKALDALKLPTRMEVRHDEEDRDISWGRGLRDLRWLPNLGARRDSGPRFHGDCA